ncbi:MAG: flagellar hook protein FlgE [Alcaligenaceae bacterium]|nr:flagellar hook protein FlgE [Alcaligenaceae bacterium]
MGFGQALSGLASSASNLDIIGNNIANSGTVGFKSSTGTFADIYANAAVGLGTQLTGVVQNFNTGTLANTGNPYDLAVDGPTGFFRVQDPAGIIKYTRNGQFLPDSAGFLTNVQGDRLTAYALDGITLVPVRVPTGNISPRATQDLTGETPVVYGLTSRVNLNANEPVSAAWALDLDDGPASGSFSHSLPVNVYDSQGNSHQLLQYFSKTADNAWKVYYVGTDTDGKYFDAGEMELSFTAAGLLKLSDPPADAEYLGEVKMLSAQLGNGVDDLSFKIDYRDSTQFGGSFNYNFSQTGYQTGEFASMSFDPDGAIKANYTNGQTATIANLVLADFTNVAGLKAVGGNSWVETTASGQPVLGTPSANGMSAIASMVVEESNVDLSKELVNLIIAQRTYQANSQTIKTQDQILQSLINLR